MTKLENQENASSSAKRRLSVAAACRGVVVIAAVWDLRGLAGKSEAVYLITGMLFLVFLLRFH